MNKKMKEEIQHPIDVYKSDIETRHDGRYYGNHAEWESIVESAGFLICPYCEGNGKIGYFCGHESSTNCYMCAGGGVVKSLNKQKHRKTCELIK